MKSLTICRSLSALCLLLAALTTLEASAAKPASELTYPTPPGIDDPEHIELSGQTNQDYFSMQAAFPSTPALAHYEKLFGEWIGCGDTDSWWLVAAGPSGMQGFYTHKFERQWISSTKDRAVMLQLQYLSSGQEPTLLPTGTTQLVTVTTTHVQDAVAHFEAIGIACPGQPGGVAAKGNKKKSER